MRTVRILVRTDIDWRTMRRATFESQTEAERPLGFIQFAVQREVLKRWHEAFGSEYFDFRADLQDIARSNLRSIEGATISYGLADFETWYSSGDDELVFPIDDDDIFHPALGAAVAEVGDSPSVVHWRHYQYTYDTQGQPTIRPVPFMVLLSNNWGIRKSFLKRHFSPDQARRVLIDHKEASLEVARIFGIPVPERPRPWFGFDLRSPPVRVLSDPCGVSVKHIGSLTSLRQALSSPDPVGSLRRQSLTARALVPPEMHWARPWLARYETIFHSLGETSPSE
jgi:hypothetical protein